MKCVRRNLTVWTTCRCETCIPDAARMRKTKLAGLYRRSSSEEALLVLDVMIERKWSNLAVATATGIKPSTASQMLLMRRKGRHLKLGPGTCKALLEHGQPTAGSVAVVGARRRVQALCRIGYTLRAQADDLKVGVTTLQAIREGRTQKIRVLLDSAIRAVYQARQMTPGPSAIAQEYAKARGWAPPMAWDDDTIDDPNAHPIGVRPTHRPRGYDEAAVLRRMAGDKTVTLTKAERVEVVRRLTAQGLSQLQIAALTGIGKPERYLPRGEAA